jgi:hypothetical protein
MSSSSPSRKKATPDRVDARDGTRGGDLEEWAGDGRTATRDAIELSKVWLYGRYAQTRSAEPEHARRFRAADDPISNERGCARRTIALGHRADPRHLYRLDGKLVHRSVERNDRDVVS